MPASNHVAAKAASGIAALIAVAWAADIAAHRFGTLAGALVIGLVFGGCGLAHALRSRRAPRLTRPASDVTITKPAPLAGLPR